MNLWLAFLLGQIVYFVMRAKMAADSPLPNHVSSMDDFFIRNWIAFVVRGIVGAGIFAILMAGPWTIEGHVIPQLPHLVAVAIMFGLIVDVLLDAGQTKWPWLKLQFPAINGNNP